MPFHFSKQFVDFLWIHIDKYSNIALKSINNPQLSTIIYPDRTLRLVPKVNKAMSNSQFLFCVGTK